MANELLTTDELATLFKLNVNHVRDRVVKLPGFPAPVVIGGARRWRAAEVRKWMKATQTGGAGK